MVRQSATPLIVGTGILRISGSATTAILGFFLAQLSSHHGRAITNIEVGLLPVAFFITELMLAPVMGALSDSWGRRKFLLIGPLFGCASVLLVPFVPESNPIPFLIGLQLISGVSSAIMVPTVLSYLADFSVSSRVRRMRVMSFYELATSGGLGVGIVVGGLAWDRLGRSAFFVLAGLYLIVCVCMLIAPQVKQIVESVGPGQRLKRYTLLLKMPRLFLFIPAWICICALIGIWLSSQLTFVLSSPHHFPSQLLMGSMRGHSSELSLVLGGLVGVFGVSLLFWGLFMGRVPRLVLMLSSVFGIFLICVALFGINHRGIGNDGLLFVWVPVLLIGIFAGSGFAPAALAYLADISEESARDRGIVMGLYSIFLGLGQLLGNSLGGIFAHWSGFDGLIYLTVLLGLVALGSLLWLWWQERSREQPPKSQQMKDVRVGREASFIATTE